MGTANITYRDFWDVPRIFIVYHKGLPYLFDCQFDERTEDYEEEYRVYMLPDLPEDLLNGSWADLAEKAEKYMGKVPVKGVEFDPTMRHTINPRIINELNSNLKDTFHEQRRT